MGSPIASNFAKVTNRAAGGLNNNICQSPLVADDHRAHSYRYTATNLLGVGLAWAAHARADACEDLLGDAAPPERHALDGLVYSQMSHPAPGVIIISRWVV